MSERKLPDTSLAAYNSVKDGLIGNHHAKILLAFDCVEYATYEKIADITGLERHQVGRRISELALQEKIYRTGIKLPTSTGRMAYAFSKAGKGIPKAEVEPAKPKRKAKPEVTDKNIIPVKAHNRHLKKEESNLNMTPLF